MQTLDIVGTQYRSVQSKNEPKKSFSENIFFTLSSSTFRTILNSLKKKSEEENRKKEI